jgi:hypothetical protein
MARKILDYDPVTGQTVWFEYDNDQMQITHEQDVSSVVDLAHEMAVDGVYSDEGIKRDMWHYAKIPNVVQLEMLNKFGVDINKREHHKRMFELLNTEYKFLKTTYKTHNVR